MQTEASIEASLADPPPVEFVSPIAGEIVSGTILVQVSADSSPGISFMGLSVDGESLGIDQYYPYIFSWDTELESPGTHTLEAIAEDSWAVRGIHQLNSHFIYVI